MYEDYFSTSFLERDTLMTALMEDRERGEKRWSDTEGKGGMGEDGSDEEMRQVFEKQEYQRHAYLI